MWRDYFRCSLNVVVGVGFTSNRPFYPATSAVYHVSVPIHPTDTNSRVTDSETEKKNEQNYGELIRVRLGKSNANVLGTRAQQTRLPRQ